MPPAFDLQGHRGARGLKPENTLPGFEVALDLGVTSLETDVQLVRDSPSCDVVPVLLHDPILDPRLFRRRAGSTMPPAPECRPRVLSDLDVATLQDYRGDRNPDPARFPRQDASLPPLAAAFARQMGIDPYAPPLLRHLFQFVAAYCGDLGQQAGKTAEQQAKARRVWFDLEVKRVPFRPELAFEAHGGAEIGLFERVVVQAIRQAGLVHRCRVRSFDHRSVLRMRQLEPRLTGAVLVAETAPVDPVALVRAAAAQFYCPDFEFLDEVQVRQCHAAGIGVLPWTVNDPKDWQRLVAWGVDGITTDDPDRLADWLRQRGIAIE